MPVWGGGHKPNSKQLNSHHVEEHTLACLLLRRVPSSLPSKESTSAEHNGLTCSGNTHPHHW